MNSVLFGIIISTIIIRRDNGMPKVHQNVGV